MPIGITEWSTVQAGLRIVAARNRYAEALRLIRLQYGPDSVAGRIATGALDAAEETVTFTEPAANKDVTP